MSHIHKVMKKVAYTCLILLIQSPILFIIDLKMRLILYLLQILISISIIFILDPQSLKLIIKIRINEFMANLLFVTLSIFLCLLSYFKNENNILLWLKIPLTITFLTIIPGFSLLSILKMKSNSILLNIFQSFIIGYFITSISTLLLRFILDNYNIQRFYLVVYSTLAFIKFLKYIFEHGYSCFSKIFTVTLNAKDLVGFLALFTLFCYAFYIVTPYGTYIINTDFSRHYMSNLIFIRSPELFYAYSYLLFDVFTSVYFLFLNKSPDALYLSIVFLNFLNNISYYIMLKMFVKKNDQTLPILSLVIWSLFSSLAWFYFTIIKLSYPFLNQAQIYWASYDPTYRSFIFTPGLWFFEYGPSYFSNFFMFTYLASVKEDIKDLKHHILLSIILTTSILTHILPPFIYIATLCLSSLLDINIKKRELSHITASIFTSIFIIIFSSLFFNFYLDKMYIITMLSLAVCPYLILLVRHYFRGTILKLSYFIKKSSNLLFTILSMFIGSSFIFWAVKSQSFRVSNVWNIGEVPWYFYPFILGTSSILAMIGLFHYLSNKLRKIDLNYFLIGTSFVFVLGKVITLFNKYLFYTFMWEHRIIQFMPIFISPFCAIALVNLSAYLKKRTLFVIVISFLTLTSTTTSLLTIEYQSLVAKDMFIKLSDAEMGAINWIKEYLDRYPNTALVTPTNRLFHVVAFAGPPYRFLMLWRDNNISFYEEGSVMQPKVSNIQKVLLISYQKDEGIKKLQEIFVLRQVFNNEQIEIFEVVDGRKMIDIGYKK